MAVSGDDRDELLNELADEFAARRRAGERPSLQEYCDRHPNLADDIRSLFPALVELEQARADAGSDLSVEIVSAPPITSLGDFRLLREVGRGGMGVVYEAEQVSLGRRVAIKLLPASVFRDPTKRRRFEREARAAAKLHHTNIVPVHGCGECDGTPYYVMQFIPGLGLDAVIDEVRRSPATGLSSKLNRPATGGNSDLSVALARSLLGDDAARTVGWEFRPDDAPTTTSAGGITPDPAPPSRSDRGSSVSHSTSTIHLPGQSGSSVGSSSGRKSSYWVSVARIGVQVAGALAYAHKLGVLHRDIKPANLLLDLDGIVWVTDFGLAKADDSDDLTHTGDVLGTLRYMPPEAFEGKSDARSDVYGLGLSLFELVALRPAYEERDRNKLVLQVTTGDPPRLRKLRRDAPRDLVTIVEKASDRDPNRRYQSAGALADDLQRFLDGRPITARRATELERMWMWARRRPAMAGMVAAMFLCLLAGTIVSTVFAVRADGFARDAQSREKDATAQRHRADQAAEVAQQNLYFAQMHLGQQAWREHRGLPQLRDLLANWLPEGDALDRRGWEWFYLNSLPYQNLRTLTKSEGTGKNLSSIVAWHAASQRLADGTRDGSIRIWDLDREQTTLMLKGPGPASGTHGQARWLAWRPDGGQLAAGFLDGTVHRWETATGRELDVFRGHKSPVRSVAYSSDGTRLASWELNGTIMVWDVNSGRLTAEVTHPGGISAGAWSPDDKSFATGHEDGTVTLSGTDAADEIVTLRGHIRKIHGLAWSPAGDQLASTSFDFTAMIWDVATEAVVQGPLRHSHEITSVAWEPTGKRLATGSIDQTVKIWSATTGREELTLRGHIESVTSLAWTPDGRLASGGEDGSVRVWESIRDQESDALPGHVVRATAVAWSPNGKRLASGGDDGMIRIWDPATREEVLAIKAHDEGRVSQQFGLILTLAWSANGSYLASGALDGTAKVWDVASGQEVFAFPADHGAVWSVAWNPDGTQLAAGSGDGTIRIVEGLNQTPKVRGFKAHESRKFGSAGQLGVRTLAWSPQGDRLASGGVDKLVKLWDPMGGAELARLPGHQYAIFRVAWSPDGQRLASCGADHGIVHVWDAKAAHKLATLRGHNDWVQAVVWSPDGTRLATAGIDNTVRIWDPIAGEETFQLRGHSGFFHDVSWHPDGAQLAAANSDGRIWIWDATLGFEQDTTVRAVPYLERKFAGKPRKNAERLRMARLAYDRKRFSIAARLWAEALACEPKLGDDHQAQHRYNAARAACRAATAPGQDEPPLDDAAKATLRRQALDWLTAELTAWGRLLESGPAQIRPTIVQTLSHWQADSELASLRDAAALAALPADEQKAFTQLWADVAALSRKGEEKSN